MRGMAIGPGALCLVVMMLAGCVAQTTRQPEASLSPDERRARAMCEDMIADDVRRQAGETMIDQCVGARLREIRAGLR